MEEKIIQFLKQNPFMYDKSKESYRNITLKEEKWKELAEEAKEDVTVVKRRWKTLRDRYVREKRKLEKPSGSSSCASQKLWKHFEMMRFLDECRTMTLINIKKRPHSPANFPLGLVDDRLTCSSYIQKWNLADGDRINDKISTTLKKKKKGDTEIEEATKSIAELVEIAKKNFGELTAIKSFFASVAMQVENENLSFERFSSLQMRVLQVVHEEIASNRVNNNYNNNYVL